jgi:hypothetical protein
MTDALDAFAALTEEDRTKLLRLQNGMKFSGSARNKVLDFAVEHGWDEATLNDVLALLPHTQT